MSKTLVYTVENVLAIDLARLKSAGIECLVFDIEGTIAPWNTADVSPEIAAHISSSGIAAICIVSNINKRHASRVKRIADIIGATAYAFPKTNAQRKPSPYMITECLKVSGVDPSKAVMVGDKLFDVLAAKRAGLKSVYWVKRLGSQDQWFDAYVYRRVEPLLKRLLRHS